MPKILEEDFERVLGSPCIPWSALNGKTVFVTGVTGLIGGLTAKLLVHATEKRGIEVRVIGLARNLDKASHVLPSSVELVQGDVCDDVSFAGKVDFIVHAASPTVSKFFVEHPTETRRVIREGTRNLLALAKRKNARMVYLSSMEVYGACNHEDVKEDDLGWLAEDLPRNSYPLGKREAERICLDTLKQGNDVVIVRPVQTFGAGISKEENRVFAQFARAVITDSDIVLKTDGKKAHCYCYTSDCLCGLLTVMLKGARGEVYNISNESTFCTIREMAEMLVGKDRVRIELDPGCYPPSFRMRVRAEKLKALGWRPAVDLQTMYDRLINWMKVLEES